MVKLLIFQLVNRELSITIKKSAITALFLMVMRRLVKRQDKRELAAGGVTSQVPEASLARSVRASPTKQDTNASLSFNERLFC